MPVSVGIDLVAVGEVEEAVAAHGERYLSRVFTEREQRAACGNPGRLAAGFAAKEAALKALGRVDEAIPWRSVALHRNGRGAPSLELEGEAARLAEDRGLVSLSVSITGTRDHAAAVVLLETAP